MSERIRPALTPEEWRDRNVSAANDLSFNHDVYDEGDFAIYGAYEGGVQSPHARHGIVALCLDGQPFGFTWEDVDDLRWAATVLRPGPDDFGRITFIAQRFQNLSDRIAALLPPRKNG